MAKKTIFRLQFESDFRIVGLFSSERDYRLGWLVNRSLGFSLQRTYDFSYIPAKNQMSDLFSVYMYHQEVYRRQFYLVSNRSQENQLMFAAPPGLDYMLLVKCDDDRFDFNSLLRQLRAIQQLTAAYQLDDSLGKNREPFLYDFELFVSQQIEKPRKMGEVMWMG